MRQTRSALRAEAIHVDDRAAIATQLPLSPVKERAPLGEVAGNTKIGEVEKGEKMAKAKRARKGKGKKGKKVEAEVSVEQQQDVVLEDERQAAGSPASDSVAEELAKQNNGDVVQVPMLDERPVSPPRAVRMTRRQLARAEEELSKSQYQAPQIEEPVEEKIVAELEEMAKIEAGLEGSLAQVEVIPSQEANPVVEEVSEPSPIQEKTPEPVMEVVETSTPEVTITPDVSEPKVLTSEKPSEDDMFSTRSSSRSPGRGPMRLEESIEAIDALEEAIEQVGKAFPEFDALESGQKSPVKRTAAKATPKGRATTTRPKPPTKAPLTSRVSRNPTVPKSLMEGPIPTITKTRPISTARPPLARAASVRNASKADGQRLEGPKAKPAAPPTDYLASKRRPVSVSFPTPPPPHKSTKPPTTSNFQLPGEAVAARLKAQREERQKREEEEAAKKPVFKARPAPARRAPAAVKQTAASKAREGLMQGGTTEENDKENKSTTTLPQKRMSSITTTASGKPQSTVISNVKRQSTLLTRPASVVGERPAFNASASQSAAAKRLSHVAGPTIPPLRKPSITPADITTQRQKGREVFNRDKIEKEERERMRREKEEAAKRARAEAAERGRIASREWAEKQKMRKAGLPAANGGVRTVAAGVGMETSASS